MTVTQMTGVLYQFNDCSEAIGKRSILRHALYFRISYIVKYGYLSGITENLSPRMRNAHSGT